MSPSEWHNRTAGEGEPEQHLSSDTDEAPADSKEQTNKLQLNLPNGLFSAKQLVGMYARSPAFSWLRTYAAKNQRVGKARCRSIYNADRQTQARQSDSTQLKAGKYWSVLDTAHYLRRRD